MFSVSKITIKHLENTKKTPKNKFIEVVSGRALDGVRTGEVECPFWTFWLLCLHRVRTCFGTQLAISFLLSACSDIHLPCPDTVRYIRENEHF